MNKINHPMLMRMNQINLRKLNLMRIKSFYFNQKIKIKLLKKKNKSNK